MSSMLARSSAATRARRPSDGAASTGSGAISRSHNQVSPRVRMMLKEDETRPAANRLAPPSTLDRAVTAPPAVTQQQRESSGDGNSASDSKTFLTALVTVQQAVGHIETKRVHRTELLRPPSPLEPMDEDAFVEPCATNYMGDGALRTFWGMFHRHDAVSNHTSTARRESSSPSASEANDDDRLALASARPASARSTYLSVVRKLQLSPEPLGIVRRRVLEKGASACASGSTAQEINLNCYRMGGAYASAFSESFALVPGVESLNLAHNRIGDRVAAQIIARAARARPLALQQLNLAHNSLSSASAAALAGLLRSSTSLTALNLSHTQLRDREVRALCEALQTNQTLTRLHLSENKFGAAGAVAVAKFLEENARIEEVYLAWNKLRGLGALRVVEALKFHASLRVVDLSWNALASNELLRPRAVVAALADALANNKVLLHLDLANNQLDLADCALLATHLESNQTLIGLHMSGNCGVVDSRGFLVPKRAASALLDQHKMYSIAVFEEAHSESGSGCFPAHVAPLADRFCWYCGQWSEYRFAWRPTPASGPFAASDRLEVTSDMGVRLHLGHDDWRGVDMERRDDGSFSAYAVLPPGKTEYFFTVFARHDESRVSHHYIHEKRHSRLVHRLGLAGAATTARDPVFGNLQFVNVVRTARREGRDPCNSLVPRSTGRASERAARWDINKSVFARRRRESVCRSFVDTDAYVAKACAADWRQCKVDRFIKDPARRREVEACVTRHFRVTSNAYRRYCGHNVLTSLAVAAGCSASAAGQLQNDIVSVPWSGYLEFLAECRVLDESSDYCKLADLENVFVAANLELTQEAKEKDNPDRSLTRFEFLECVIRIALNKYHRTNVCDSPAKAVEKLVLEHLLPVCRDDPNDFRTKFLYTEEVSDIFSEHIVLLQEIFNSNMGRYCKPGEKKGMQLVEFLQILERYQVYNEHFRVRDVKDPFLACKLVVLDEMATAGHKKLYLTDFMELLLRVSVLRYPPRSLAVADAAKSLQTLVQHHFCHHEDLLDNFRDAVEQAVVQDHVEAFTTAIGAQKKPPPLSSVLAATRDSSAGRQRRPLANHPPLDEDAEVGDDDGDEGGEGEDNDTAVAARGEEGAATP
ncbi:hypothetical protein PybrP1_011629 [[Pythium] brassicae (nom. inval.)]|nr:hypothetical protein PybrP1_011629 [[Pythium] brassicae (nom. inval.)]